MWYKIIIPFTDTNQKEQIIAWLDDLEIDSILEEEEYLEAFTNNVNPEEIVSKLKGQINIEPDGVIIHEVENKNWNAIWEANFEPIVVNGVCIRAPFHAANENCTQEIIIKPKMAFGTGHHETTSMMINYMRNLNLESKKVFDFGCGTGILSIYAAMQGSDDITGIDIQIEAIENSYEHIKLNNLDKRHFRFEQGGINILEDQKYDLILANINRHVLEQTAYKLYGLMNSDSLLMCSGILKSDEVLITNLYTNAGFDLIHNDYKGEWCLFVFNKGI